MSKRSRGVTCGSFGRQGPAWEGSRYMKASGAQRSSAGNNFLFISIDAVIFGSGGYLPHEQVILPPPPSHDPQSTLIHVVEAWSFLSMSVYVCSFFCP